MIRLEHQIGFYAADLLRFKEDNGLSDDFFKKPDHLAYKCHDGKHYDYEVGLAIPDSARIVEVTKDNRRLAVAQLSSSILIPEAGFVSWLEIMEPRPEKAGKDYMGIEHMEYFYRDLAGACEVFDTTGIDYELQANDEHAWISIAINDKGREVKLSDKLLSNIVHKQLHEGRAKVIYPVS